MTTLLEFTHWQGKALVAYNNAELTGIEAYLQASKAPQAWIARVHQAIQANARPPLILTGESLAEDTIKASARQIRRLFAENAELSKKLSVLQSQVDELQAANLSKHIDLENQLSRIRVDTLKSYSKKKV